MRCYWVITGVSDVRRSVLPHLRRWQLGGHFAIVIKTDSLAVVVVVVVDTQPGLSFHLDVWVLCHTHTGRHTHNAHTNTHAGYKVNPMCQPKSSPHKMADSEEQGFSGDTTSITLHEVMRHYLL